MKIIRYIFTAILVIQLMACERMLEISPESEFAPSNVLTTENGIRSLLYSAYLNFQGQTAKKDVINFSEVTTDIAFNTGGNENLYLTQFINFTWDPSVTQLQGIIWGPYYRVIRDANSVLENMDQVQASDASKRLFIAEARFLRAYCYAFLHNWYGPVPLRTSGAQEKDLARASEDELKAFIESELEACVSDLPDPGAEELWGRANKGAALAVLSKFLLNTKQWDKAAIAAKRVMDLDYYELFPVFKDLFKVENERNSEMILVTPAINQFDFGNWFPAGAMPPGFVSTPQLPEYRWIPGIQNFATQYRLRDQFVNTFSEEDDRYVLVVRTYVNTAGQTIDLTATTDNTRSLKYFDNNAVSNAHGNDVPIVRYADILLTRAEALNEINGPNTESLTLLNEVRRRSSLADLEIGDFPSTEAFRDAILRERGWEFFSEGKRREDLIRHGKFISFARERGVNADERHVVFPIPQSEVDANSAIIQTEGY
ncbi:RagB/SusD family nutrient uptake outer membrane protein [Parapedobacter pyrenivorans]|nr:RagB/SusD family nutrient uptake outer membrane protein [Parapedobacter pyrenivorans]